MVCGDFILPESANYVSLFCFLNLRNLLYLIAIERQAAYSCYQVSIGVSAAAQVAKPKTAVKDKLRASRP